MSAATVRDKLAAIASAERKPLSLSPSTTPRMSDDARAAWAATLESQYSNIALTLVYNALGINRDRIRHDLRDLHGRVDRQFLGPRFHKKPVNERSKFWAVVAKLDSHPHVHLGWHLPVGANEILAEMFSRGVWKNRDTSTEFDLQSYTPGWASYACSAGNLTDPADVIFSADFVAFNDSKTV